MIGYGWMARVHTFAFKNINLNIQREPKINLIAVSGRTHNKLMEMAEKFKYKRFFTEWEQVVKDPDVNLIDIVTPPNVHRDPAIMAAEEKKSLICEKPIASTVSDAKEMVKAVESTTTPNMTMFNYRYIPAILRAKKWVNEGNLGKLFQSRFLYTKQSHLNPKRAFSWKDDPIISGGGAMIDLGVHVADLARFLVGDVSRVTSANDRWVHYRPEAKNSSTMRSITTEDAGVSILKFKDGTMGILEASKTSTGHPNTVRVELHGSKGALMWNSEKTHELYLHHQADGENNWRVEYIPSPFDDSYGRIGIGHVNALTDFINQYNKPNPTYPSFRDGLESLKIIDASYRSAKEERWIKLE
jgi:predicted dehydrogenase